MEVDVGDDWHEIPRMPSESVGSRGDYVDAQLNPPVVFIPEDVRLAAKAYPASKKRCADFPATGDLSLLP